MTRWLQDKPAELSARLRSVASGGDLRVIGVADEARALMHAASDMIGREIMTLPMNDMNYSRRGCTAPLHWSWRDRVSDALACLVGKARVLRRD